MQISTRLTLAWTLAGLLVFGGYGAWLVQRERTDLFRSVEREVWLLGTSLQVAVENALRDGQLADVDETTAKIEQIDPAVDVTVFGLDEQVLLTTGSTALTFPADPEGPHLEYAPGRLMLVAPLREAGQARFGTVVVSRPLADVQRDLAATTGTIALTVGVFVVTSAALGWLLGHTYIGRPLASLTAAMRDVRGGNLRPLLATPRDDEIGAVAGEFDEMMEALAAARERLQAAAESRRQLERALQQADKLATLGQLAATVAHEIGSPLQVLHGRAQALLRSPDDPKRVQKHAEILVRETDRIARIVEQLLAWTRPSTTPRGPVDLAPLVRQTVELFEIEARRRGVRVDFSEQGDARVAGSADRLQQIVVNLLSNALAASAPGDQVVLALSRTGSEVVLEVRDSGDGMAPEVVERAFEPFFTTRAEAGGTGLGLAVVRGIVDDHGGRIDVSSTPGHGTILCVRLPEAA